MMGDPNGFQMSWDKIVNSTSFKQMKLSWEDKEAFIDDFANNKEEAK
jgi:hypothetical protein